MRHSSGTFEGADGLRLHVQAWHPEADPRGALALVHGWGEHGGRYGELVTRLVGQSWAVHALDLRGHGRSPGPRGHIDAWRQYREDVAAFVAHVRAAEPEGLPIVLYGHSLGGAIALEYGLHQPNGLAGVIASAPALEPVGVRSAVLESLARALSRLWPTFAVRLPLETAALSRRVETSQAYEHDPLNHGRLSVRGATEAMAALAWTRAHADEWRLPLLIVHGDADRIADPQGSRMFVAAARAGGAPDVTLELLPGGYHEPHNDLDVERLLTIVEAWLERHCTGSPGARPA